MKASITTRTNPILIRETNMKIYSAIALIAVSMAASVQSANILAVFPFPAKSHQAVFRPVVTGLADRGHKVTFVTPLPLDNPPANLNQIKIGNVMDKLKNFLHEEPTSWISRAVRDIVNSWVNLLVRQIGHSAAQVYLQEPKLQEIIQDTKTKYDLILLETTFAQECLTALSHKFGAPIVEVMPCSNLHWSYYLHGIPYDTSYIMDIDVSYTDHMTFVQRLINTVMSLTDRFINTYYYMPKAEQLASTYIKYPGSETRPPLIDLVKNTSLFLVNSDLAVNYPFPLPPNAKEIGGINLQTERKPLPKELQDFMDGAKDGVIYFTMGSHIEVSTTLGDKLKDEFLKAFGKIKQRVLWKWEVDFPNLPPNVKISKWFPQQDIMAHKNMRLFISHGGLLSMTEAVYNGVPIIGIPIMGDQPKNVQQIKSTGYGVHLDFNNLTESSILWAINEITSNPRYSEIAKERSSIYRDKKYTPQETAMYWIEYVLRHNGARHLKPAITSLPWCQQALLDVYSFLAIILLTPVIITYLVVRKIFRCICCRKSSKNETKSAKKKKKE